MFNHPFYQNPGTPSPTSQQPQMPQGMNFMQKLQEFQQMLNGNPEAIAKNLLSSGRMSQQQFSQYAQIADQITGRRPF